MPRAPVAWDLRGRWSGYSSFLSFDFLVLSSFVVSLSRLFIMLIIGKPLDGGFNFEDLALPGIPPLLLALGMVGR